MILIKNIGELVGIVPAGVLRKQGAEMAETGVLRDAWLAIEDGKIKAFGKMADLAGGKPVGEPVEATVRSAIWPNPAILPSSMASQASRSTPVSAISAPCFRRTPAGTIPTSSPMFFISIIVMLLSFRARRVKESISILHLNPSIRDSNSLPIDSSFLFYIL